MRETPYSCTHYRSNTIDLGSFSRWSTSKKKKKNSSQPIPQVPLGCVSSCKGYPRSLLAYVRQSCVVSAESIVEVWNPHTRGALIEALGNCQSVWAILRHTLKQTHTELCGCQPIKADMAWILDGEFEIYHPSKRGGCLDHVKRFDIDPVTTVRACQ